MRRVSNMSSITRIVMDFALTNESTYFDFFRLGLRKQRIKEPPFFLTPKIYKERRINWSFTRLVCSDCAKV